MYPGSQDATMVGRPAGMTQAGMAMPGSAPSTPPSNDPAVSTVPSLNSLVASPKYQTLPRASCAYQSVVRSSSLPDR